MRLIEAREEELGRRGASLQFRTVKSAEDFGEKVYSTLGYMALQGGRVKSIEADHAISHIGKASYIAIILKGVHHFASQRISFLPGEICAQKQLSQDKLFSCQPSKELSDVVFELASRGNYHISHAEKIKVPKEARPFLMESVVLSRFYEKLRSNDFQVFDTRVNEKDGMLPLRLLFHKWKGWF